MQYNGMKGCEEMGRRKNARRSNGCGNLTLRGNTYYARWVDSLGNRREVSTHTANYDEALAILATYTKPQREAQSNEELKLRLQQSIDILELRKDIKKVDRLKVDDLIEKFKNHRDLCDTTEQTKSGYESHLKALIKTLNNQYPNIKYIDEITMDVVEGIMSSLTKRYTANSFNLALATYRRCWGMFARTNPFIKVSKRKIDKSRHRIAISEDDVRNILSHCRNDEERAIWGVGVYCGLRCGDICNLTYGHLDESLKTISIIPMKTKRHCYEPIVIPVCNSLKMMLLKVIDFSKVGNEEFKNLPLFPTWKSRYASGKACTLLSRTLTRSGIETSIKDEDGHKKVLTGFHCTRHFFVSTASRYMSPLLVQRIVGHSTINMTSHYYHSNIDDMANGLSNMPDFSNAPLNAPTSDLKEEVMQLLSEMHEGQENPLETLKRLISKANVYSSAS